MENIQHLARSKSQTNMHVRVIPRIIQWGTYPALLLSSLAAVAIDIRRGTPGEFSAYITGATVLILLLLEFLYPMKQEWKMNWFNAKRDAFFMLVGAVNLAVSNWLLITFSVSIAPQQGLLIDVGVLPGAVIALVVFQGFQYGLHRAEHELTGKLGKFAWRVHRPHHVCDRVYVLMHGRGHPIEGFFVRAIFIIPLALIGINENSLYLLSVLIVLQGTVSHLNVDLRAGWFNYLLTGTELHRFHHSADISEGKNFGAVTPLFDIIFGTFVYRPLTSPQKLGVDINDEGPDNSKTLSHLLYPFRQ